MDSAKGSAEEIAAAAAEETFESWPRKTGLLPIKRFQTILPTSYNLDLTS